MTGGQTYFGQPLQKELYRYNSATDVWNTDAAPMPMGLHVLDMCVCAGKLYAGCAYAAARSLFEYDPVEDMWEKIKDVPSLEQTALCSHDGKLYAFGSTSDLHAVYAYNPATGTWKAKSAMPTGRIMAVACSVKELIYVVGGNQDKTYPRDLSQTVGVVEAYDPIEDIWYTGFEPMLTPRFAAGACVIDSIIYVVGGKKTSGDCKLLEAYNPPARVSVKVEQLRLPDAFVLKQNYPNPFNPTTTIEYTLPQASFVTLTVYDLLGKEIRKLVQEQQPAGTHSVLFRAGNLPSNIYFYKLQAENLCEIRKMLLVR